ncbi:hypothetical protein SYK_05100 [Pseudodesulfovibrio nedwellii]|uniref:Uncharacterized protein n=1 Tax=Pseudodesulfovibrio nedwellii TaxID=2973072 RepID=A0ABM8AXA0_9BACT|nr:hypothetical protein [Pseudodesulfovibrio nedwellii]BDQ36150.1 hypothetical protein SYK_05100 [Pseudodesulfovibrio nedwellii]
MINYEFCEMMNVAEARNDILYGMPIRHAENVYGKHLQQGFYAKDIVAIEYDGNEDGWIFVFTNENIEDCWALKVIGSGPDDFVEITNIPDEILSILSYNYNNSGS